MKTFLLLVLSVTALFVWQRQGNDAERSSPPPPPTAEARSVAAPLPRAVSEQNWAKHSLDRAHAVADQVRESRQPGE